MANARLEELKARFDENPRRYFAPYANELRKTGDHAQAVSICRSHLAVQPGHVSGHIVLAQALSESGALDESRAEFEAALELDPENLIALRAMGDLARARGDAAIAREWYQRVLDADPRNEEIARTLREMASKPNEYASPPAAPAPLSMLVPDTPFAESAARTDGAGDAPVPSAESSTLEREDPAVVVQPIADANSLQAPAAVATAAAPEPEPRAADPVGEARAADPVDAMDDFVPFESLDSIEPPGTGAAAPPPPVIAAQSVDLSDFTVMEHDASQPTEEPSAAEARSAELDPAWTNMDEFALSEERAAPAAGGDETDQHGHDVSAASEAADAPWMTPMTPAPDLGDYEAAPELSFEEDPAPSVGAPAAPMESRPNGATAPSQSAYDDDIESWFDTHETPAAPPAPASAPEPVVAAEERTSDVAEEPPAVELHAFAEAPTEEVALPERHGPAGAAADAAGDSPDPNEPGAAGVSADPLVGRTPTLVEAVPDTPAAPFVTETLAELYLQQGFRDEALAIYRQLIEREPSDLSLRRRVEAIERGAASDVVPDIAARSSTTGHRASMSVRTFFGRLARRAPSRPASGGGSGRGSRTTGSWEAIGRQADTPGDGRGTFADGPPLEPARGLRDVESHSTQSSALATLFATARPSEADTRAASALASAFGETSAPLSPYGRPSRTAERELSLDHLFRDDAGPAGAEHAPAAGSLDEFYGSQSPTAPSSAESGPDARGSAAPGARSPASDERNTDLRQFTAWLEGLKKK